MPTADARRTIRLIGAWTLLALGPRSRKLGRELADLAGDPQLIWDLREVGRLDDAGAVLLWRAWGRKKPAGLELRPEQEMVFEHLAGVKEARPAVAPLGLAAPLILIGRWLDVVVGHMHGLLLLIGQLALDLIEIIVHPTRIPWKEISANLYRTGSQALGITALVGFLIGVVLSYLSAKQLHLFGADVFIVNLLGIAVIRELGPVLAAILVAGRSGSAMTAQLGVMRVTQELDAMTVMGIPHGRRLILPKAIALAIAMPLLILWTSTMALAGGMLAAEYETGLSHTYFIDSLRSAVPIANYWLGLGKGVVFGLLIALIACHFGLRIRPNTESLGRGVTASVVSAITIVILADAIFAIVFSNVGIVQ
ncbi:MAG: ABC transporter permease [Proteobacteria bacterium]|nr:ABC transporter permease [Burkholderiales bacterium]